MLMDEISGDAGPTWLLGMLLTVLKICSKPVCVHCKSILKTEWEGLE